jgi:hypothetical protein
MHKESAHFVCLAHIMHILVANGLVGDKLGVMSSGAGNHVFLLLITVCGLNIVFFLTAKCNYVGGQCLLL